MCNIYNKLPFYWVSLRLVPETLSEATIACKVGRRTPFSQMRKPSHKTMNSSPMYSELDSNAHWTLSTHQAPSWRLQVHFEMQNSAI